MNTATLVVTILTLWLVMGLGFLSAYAEIRRKDKTFLSALKSKEGILFILSIFMPIFYAVFRTPPH